MNPLLVAVVAALLVPAVTRGSYRRLAEASFEMVPILLLGLGIQVALDLGLVPETRWHDVGFGLLVASLVLVLAFCVRNVDHRGMGVVLVGVAANTLAIVVNQGMPVDVPASWIADGSYTETVKHHAQTPDDTLIVLTDIIVIPEPFETVISFGDIVVALGMVVVVFHASRKPRSSRRGRVATIDPHDIDLSALLGYESEVPEPQLSEEDGSVSTDRAPPGSHDREPDEAQEADDGDDPTEPTAVAGSVTGPSQARSREGVGLLVGGRGVEQTSQLEHPLE